MTGLMHSRDKIINYNQLRVVATCGMRVRAKKTIFAPLIPKVFNSEITCVGCKAILREREKEAQCAETPVQRKTEKPQ
jgi:hypothetical protein